MTANQLKTQLETGINTLNLSLSEQAVDKLLKFIDLLEKWNKAYNLTAIQSPEEMLYKHILDSLAIAPYIKGQRVLDVGTGAGLPGIPLAVMFEDREMILLDSNGKKIRFLIQAIAELGLDASLESGGNRVEPVQGRIESYHPERPFDTIVMRAFADINTIIERCEHLLTPDNQLVLMKGSRPDPELAQVTLPFEVHAVKVPGLNAERHVVIIRGH